MKEEKPKIKKSDLFPVIKLAPHWLADEFSISETMMVEEVPAESFIMVPAVTKTTFLETGSIKFDQRKKYDDVIIFVNPESVPEQFKQEK